MKEESIVKGIRYYVRFGLLYGVCRSSYWLTNLNDKTYDYYKKDYVTHRPTVQAMCGYAFVNSVISQAFWPFFMLKDYSVYEKNQMGIRDLTPPYPFETLHWKGDKK